MKTLWCKLFHNDVTCMNIDYKTTASGEITHTIKTYGCKKCNRTWTVKYEGIV